MLALLFPKLRVIAAERNQLPVGAALGDLTVLHIEDAVAIRNGGKLLADYDGRSALKQGAQTALYGFLRYAVNGGEGIVKNKQLRLADKGAGKGYPLLLTARKMSTALANLRCVAIGKNGGIGCVYACGVSGFFYILLRNALSVKCDITRYAVGEKKAVLRHGSAGLAPGICGHMADIRTVNEDAVFRSRAGEDAPS